jgi:hypothetical protein
MRRAALLALLIALLSGATFASPSPKEKRSPKPRVKLAVSSHHGFVPFTITLEAELIGFDEGDPRSCVVRVERESAPGKGQPRQSKRESPCENPGGRENLPKKFEQDFDLFELGTYSYRIVLKTREGDIVLSPAREVRALRAPLEIRGTVRGTAPDR